MFEECKCIFYGDQVEFWCLYYIELMCVKCKFDDCYNQCLKDIILVKIEFLIIEFDKMNLYLKCRDIYIIVFKVINEIFLFLKNDLRKVLENLDLIFRILGDRMKLLQEDVINSVYEIKEMCFNNCIEFQVIFGMVLIDIGKFMKEFCEDIVDVV